MILSLQFVFEHRLSQLIGPGYAKREEIHVYRTYAKYVLNAKDVISGVCVPGKNEAMSPRWEMQPMDEPDIALQMDSEPLI